MLSVKLDYDDIDELSVIRYFYNAHYAFSDKEIECRISASRKGMHLVLHDAVTSWDEQIQARQQLLDDDNRIHIDIMQHRYGLRATNVLWTYKNGRRAVCFADNIDFLVQFLQKQQNIYTKNYKHGKHGKKNYMRKLQIKKERLQRRLLSSVLV